MAADTRNLTLSIYRYNPEVDDKPYMKDYEIAIPSKSDPMLLMLLERIKAEQDPTLTFRRSCREGVCGSDGMNINGTNGLACVTHISSLNGDKIVIRPLPGFPIIRDLAVDLTQFYQQYERIEPYLQNKEEVNVCKALRNAPSWMACMSVYCALVVRARAHLTGGIRINS